MLDFFINAYKNTPLHVIILEAIAFLFGIASVYFAKKQNIWVYPTGLIATSITVYLLYRAEYFGDMIINFYYSVMSIYGWYNWSQKDKDNNLLSVTRTSLKEKLIGVALFFLTIVVIFGVYKAYDYEIRTENYFDILTAGIFFTAMWYMALKKLESWPLWIIGNIIVIPLYAYRGLGMLSLQYIIFTILAVQAYVEWRKILNSQRQSPELTS